MLLRSASSRTSRLSFTRYVVITKNLIKPSLIGESETAAGSLEFRQACIHGNVDSYHESNGPSKDSNDQIDSMNFVNNSPTGKNASFLQKKENIYKATLKNANHINLHDYESFCSNNSSKEECDSKEPSPERRRAEIRINQRNVVQKKESSRSQSSVRKNKLQKVR
jgi:hypothetical protein